MKAFLSCFFFLFILAPVGVLAEASLGFWVGNGKIELPLQESTVRALISYPLQARLDPSEGASPLFVLGEQIHRFSPHVSVPGLATTFSFERPGQVLGIVQSPEGREERAVRLEVIEGGKVVSEDGEPVSAVVRLYLQDAVGWKLAEMASYGFENPQRSEGGQYPGWYLPPGTSYKLRVDEQGYRPYQSRVRVAADGIVADSITLIPADRVIDGYPIVLLLVTLFILGSVAAWYYCRFVREPGRRRKGRRP